jgi:IclR family acetate operon transcriptional repressor
VEDLVSARPTLIASVQRALHLLDEVGAASHPLSAKTLAHRTGLALPTTYHLLQTLVHEGYLTRSDHCYVLGDRILAFAAPDGSASRIARLRPVLRQLHDELHAAAYLAVLDDGEVRLVEVVDSPAAPRVDQWVGFHDAAHATALGKATLSVLPEPQRRDYLARHGLVDLTAHTITDGRVLLRQLQDPGALAVDREEYAVGTCCVAAAVPSSSTIAAVAVSVPAAQVGRVVEHAEAIRRAARLVAYAVEDGCGA